MCWRGTRFQRRYFDWRATAIENATVNNFYYLFDREIEVVNNIKSKVYFDIKSESIKW